MIFESVLYYIKRFKYRFAYCSPFLQIELKHRSVNGDLMFFPNPSEYISFQFDALIYLCNLFSKIASYGKLVGHNPPWALILSLL